MGLKNKNINQNIFDDDIGEEEEFYDESKEDFVDEEDFDDFSTNFSNNAQVQKIWLDTEPYLNQIYLALTNKEMKKFKVTDKHGESEYITKVVSILDEQGKPLKPLANSFGISQIMGRIKSMVAKDIVQGNLNDKRYNNFMYYFSIKVKKMLIVDRMRFDMELNDVNNVSNIICDSVEVYLTRPINNLERDRDKVKGNNDNSEYQNKGFWDKINFMRNKNKNNAGA